jgi:catechol 2,3-dioxygenase-like lactoylglutathione lyase family enzyme
MARDFEHIAVGVTDLEKSVEFYTKVLGFSVLRRSSTRMEAGEIDIVYVNRGRYAMELISVHPRKEEGKPVESAVGEARMSVGMSHIGFAVDNLDEELKRLEKLGVKIVSRSTIPRERFVSKYRAKPRDAKLRAITAPGKKPWRLAFFTDPDGVRIELVER